MDTWWIDEPVVIGSGNPTDADVERFRRDGFTILVSLLEEDDQPPRYDPRSVVTLGSKRHNIPVRDSHAPSLAQLVEFVELVRSMPRGAKLVVHCEGGTGRTGTVAAAYWIARGLSVAEAIARVRKARPGAVETDAQMAALYEFAEHVVRSGTLILTTNPIELLADGLALVYHEARNVRFLIQASVIPAARWEKLVALPKKPVDNWKVFQPLRSAARLRPTASECARVFEQRFGRSLSDLLKLFADPNWKHAKAYGGNAWRDVVALVVSLHNAVAQGDQSAVRRACQDLVSARDNNGTLREKIIGLDEAVGARAADWWALSI